MQPEAHNTTITPSEELLTWLETHLPSIAQVHSIYRWLSVQVDGVLEDQQAPSHTNQRIQALKATYAQIIETIPPIRVEDVCFTQLFFLDLESSVASAEKISQEHNIDTLFIKEQHNDLDPTFVVGWIHKEQIQKAMDVSSEITVSAIMHEAPLVIAGEVDVQHLDLSAITNPMILVQQEHIIGWIDRSSLQKALHQRYPLHHSWMQYIPRPEQLQQIITASIATNTPLYIIGGAVRDILLKRMVSDIDFCTEKDPTALVAYLLEKYGGRMEKHAQFGAVHWITPTGEHVDFTNARSERYPTLASLPHVFPSYLAKDITRRDITINALALSIHSHTHHYIIDLVEGMRDLQQKTIRVLHPFSLLEDPTRIFRMARYAARYGYTIDAHTLHLLEQALEIIEANKQLTLQRIGIEIGKIMKEPDVALVFQQLCDWGVCKKWFPFWTESTIHMLSSVETIAKQLQPSYLYSHEEIESAMWAILSISMTDTERKTHKDLSATRSNGLKEWKGLPTDLSTIMDAISNMDTISNIDTISKQTEHPGFILEKTSPVHWILLSIYMPSAQDPLHWWISTGKELRLQINGHQLQERGCPKGPHIQQCLRIAKKALWEQRSLEDQWLAVDAYIATIG